MMSSVYDTNTHIADLVFSIRFLLIDTNHTSYSPLKE